MTHCARPRCRYNECARISQGKSSASRRHASPMHLARHALFRASLALREVTAR